MTVHLARLAVGTRDMDHLRSIVKQRASKGRNPKIKIHTRNTPKRKDELMDGGCLYWIVKGQIRVRLPILAIDTVEDEKGKSMCEITLSAKMIPTLPKPHRPMQGWRYLEPEAAPPDLVEGDTTDMPEELVQELRDLGLV